MNKYKKLVSNTLIFAIGSFGSKILLLLLTRLYTGNINPGDNSTKEPAGTDRKLSDSDHYFFHCRCSHSLRH